MIALLQGEHAITVEDFKKAMNDFASANALCVRPSYSPINSNAESQDNLEKASKRLYWGKNVDILLSGELACKDPAFPGVSTDFFANAISDPVKLQRMKASWSLAIRSKFENLSIT